MIHPVLFSPFILVSVEELYNWAISKVYINGIFVPYMQDTYN